MPEDEPASQRLADIHSQNTLGGCVADESDDHSKIDDVFQVIDLKDVSQEAGEEGPASQGDHSQVCCNPKTKGKIVVKVCHVKGQAPAHEIGKDTHQKGAVQKGHPEQKPFKLAPLNALWDQYRIKRG
jgi:hypothetical protein